MEYLGNRPQIGENVYIAESACLIGNTGVGAHSSIWFNTVLRGDINRVTIGHHTNLQDHTICHVADDQPCVIGNYVSVGHRVILHGCNVYDEVLIGMGAILMNGVEVGTGAIIGAGSLLTEGFQAPPNSLIYGSPAKVVRSLTQQERLDIKLLADKYTRIANNYLVQK